MNAISERPDPAPTRRDANSSSAAANGEGLSRGRLLLNMILFARLLRVGELKVTPTQVANWILALDHIDLTSKEQVRDAARATLVANQSEISWFEEAFELFWRSRGETDLAAVELGLLIQRQERESETLLHAPRGDDAGHRDGEPVQVPAWSDERALRQKNFALMTGDERSEVESLISRWSLRPLERPSRRVVARRRGDGLDLRLLLRRNLRYGGELIELPRQRKKTKPRPLVVLCDISGSMEPFARLLLHFVYALSQAHGRRTRVEAFTFATELTRLSPDLRGHQIDRALRNARARITDWGGGTRTGESLRTFHQRWASRALSGGAVVLIISDGWDRGDPVLLSRQMRHLALNSESVIWLNPLLGSPGYEPLTRGMQAALPFVDHFLPVHNLRSLEQLAALLGTVQGAAPGPVASGPAVRSTRRIESGRR